MNVSQSGTDEPMCDVNTTPLIDVMLVLLVMLIVTLPIQTHAVKLDLPPPNPNAVPPTVEPERINIEVDPDGTIVVNGTPVSGILELDQFFAQQSGKEPQPEIHLRPSGLSLYDTTVNVMASAQRNHMVRMGFTNVGEFAE
ncbi:MAG: biopolymer transporter ExbD [Steroidobacteraceae bacterium]